MRTANHAKKSLPQKPDTVCHRPKYGLNPGVKHKGTTKTAANVPRNLPVFLPSASFAARPPAQRNVITNDISKADTPQSRITRKDMKLSLAEIPTPRGILRADAEFCSRLL